MLFFVVLLLVSFPATAQKDTTLQIGGPTGKVSAKGYIGGEAHDRYTVSVSAEQRLRISISSRRNRAEFTVSESGDISDATPVAFGAWEKNRRSWAGIIPRTGAYYVFVTAHPTSSYSLSVEVAEQTPSAGGDRK